MNCLFCKAAYADDDIKEMREMGDEFSHDSHCFICPDCYDRFKRRDPGEQLEILMRERY